MMKNMFREMVRLLRNNESFVVATVFAEPDSAPSNAGAKMIVRPDGSVVGSVGGGRLEAAAVRLVKEVLFSRQSWALSFDLTDQDASDMDLICGGRGGILLDFIDSADDNNRNIYEEALAVMERCDWAWLITAFGDMEGAGCQSRQQCLAKRDGTFIGRFHYDAELLTKLIFAPAQTSIHAEVFDNHRFLVEIICSV